MIEFLNRLFGRQSSGATAKERLRLVLMSDHLSLAPEMIDAMKRDLVDVISHYVEVDRDRIDVHFEHQDRAIAMLANIPITGVARNGDTLPHTANATSNGVTNGAPLCHPEPFDAAQDRLRELGEVAASAVEGQANSVEAAAIAVDEDVILSEHDAPSAARAVEGRPSLPRPEVQDQPELVPSAQRKSKTVTAKNAARPRRKRRKSSGA